MSAGERQPLLSSESTRPQEHTVQVIEHRRRSQTIGPKDLKKTTRYGILAGVWMATFLCSVNMTLVPTMLPAISSEFNRSNQASWLGTAYLLATCTFTPLYGRLCNVLGRRGANQSAVFFAGLGTLLCGCSRTMNMLIFARFLGGIGGGATFTTSTIVISDMYSLRSRGLAQGVSAVFTGLGMGLGGPFGGVMTDLYGWRTAFLVQMPLFLASICMTSYFLHYATPGRSKSTLEVLKRIDWLGSLFLLISVGACLFFLSARYNALQPWSSADVIAPLVLSILSLISFVFIELYLVPEPVLAPFLLKQRIPVLVGISNFLVAMCNFTITYYFPMWFQTVMLTSASIAGLHLLPNSVSMSSGSMFAGWMMHRTGKYKMLNLIFGAFPFIATIFISLLREDSGPVQSWLSIIPLGFGNAVVVQTMLIALLAHIPETHMAVGTGFGQLFRGVGQVGGVAVSSAIFQSRLDAELRKRIHTPDAETLITRLRESVNYIYQLSPELQRQARDSYDTSLKAVFIYAACSTFLAYIVRLPVPERSLDSRPKAEVASPRSEATPASLTRESPHTNSSSSTVESEDEADPDVQEVAARPRSLPQRPRRLSTFESADSYMDLESATVGGSARTPSHILSRSI